MKPINIYVGNLLQGFRESKKISQVDMAKKLNLSRASIVNIEAGRQGLNMFSLMAFAEALEVEPAELIPPMEWFKKTKNKQIEKIVTYKIV